MFGFRKKDDGIHDALMKEHEEYVRKQKALTREILPGAPDETLQIRQNTYLRQDVEDKKDISKEEIKDLGLTARKEPLPVAVKVFLILFFGPTILFTVIPGLIALVIGLLSILL